MPRAFRLVRLVVVAAVCALALCAQAVRLTAADVADPLPSVVARASTWAAAFARSAVSLLAREHYEQEVRRRAGSSAVPIDSDAGVTIERRVLDSEVALVETGAEYLWLLARDVQQVDGKAVADKDRIPLPAVGRLSQDEAVQAFRRVAGQGARYNIGRISRDMNVPTLALWLFIPGLAGRLRFEVAGREPVAGIECEVVRYTERRAPYLFQANGVPTAVRGRAWIASDTGAILRTELILESRSGTGRARVTVTYAFDERLQQWVPREMSERYDDLRRQAEGFVMGTASYRDYRRFETSTRIR